MCVRRTLSSHAGTWRVVTPTQCQTAFTRSDCHWQAGVRYCGCGVTCRTALQRNEIYSFHICPVSCCKRPPRHGELNLRLGVQLRLTKLFFVARGEVRHTPLWSYQAEIETEAILSSHCTLWGRKSAFFLSAKGIYFALFLFELKTDSTSISWWPMFSTTFHFKLKLSNTVAINAGDIVQV